MYQKSRRSFIRSSASTAFLCGLSPLAASAEKTAGAENAPDETGRVFLFQGDSITDGNRGRNNDPNHVMGHGYAFSIASRIGADFSQSDLSFYNRGISGNTIPDLQKRWQTDTLELKPNVLSLLVGINDAHAVVSNPSTAPNIEDFETGYRDLLLQSKAANPNILFVLGSPFVYAVGSRKEQWEVWKTETDKRGAVVKKLEQEFNAVYVDYNAAFAEAMKKKAADYWIWDGIHPTVPGHEIMARAWIKAVSSRLKFLRYYRY